VGGPIAFWAGERLGAVDLARPLWLALLRLSVCWGVALWGLSLATRAGSAACDPLLRPGIGGGPRP
jgi:type IV secretory pathway TrbD component